MIMDSLVIQLRRKRTPLRDEEKGWEKDDLLNFVDYDTCNRSTESRTLSTSSLYRSTPTLRTMSSSDTGDFMSNLDSFSTYYGGPKGILKCKTVLDSLEKGFFVATFDRPQRKSKCHVRFSFVTVHYHRLALGDSDMTNGPLLTLGRWVESEVFEDLDHYEEDRPYEVRPDYLLRMKPSFRRSLLLMQDMGSIAEQSTDETPVDVETNVPIQEGSMKSRVKVAKKHFFPTFFNRIQRFQKMSG